MERRKIVSLNGEYFVLKPQEGNNRWYNVGRKTTIQGIYTLVFKRNDFEFVVSEDILNELREYDKHRKIQSSKYSKSIESKTI